MTTKPHGLCQHTYPHVRHSMWLDEPGPTGSRVAHCPGVKLTADMRTMPASVRRETLAALRSLRGYVGWMVNHWNVDSLIHVDGRAERPRKIDEYPENSAAAWSALERDARYMARKFTALADAASNYADAISRAER
jgi:hypothetical protein